jgi:hypothetical protein
MRNCLIFIIAITIVTQAIAGPAAYAACMATCSGGCILTGPCYPACWAACVTYCTPLILAPTP